MIILHSTWVAVELILVEGGVNASGSTLPKVGDSLRQAMEDLMSLYI
ncbi:hypothetical protein TNCT_401471, partial [Trichonephila clavata]